MSCDILTRHVKNISVNALHYCDAVAFLVGKMSWFWVQGWTFVWRCWSNLSFLGFKSCSTLDALDTWPIGFALSQKKKKFFMYVELGLYTLIRGPSPENLDSLLLSNTKYEKITFLNVSLTLFRGWGQTDMNAAQAHYPCVRTHLISRGASASPTTREAQGARGIGARWLSTGWWRPWCFSFLLAYSYCAMLC